MTDEAFGDYLGSFESPKSLHVEISKGLPKEWSRESERLDTSVKLDQGRS